MSALKWIIVIAVIGAAIWWFTRDPVEVAYQKCLAGVSAKMEKSIKVDSSNAVEKAMADAVKGMGSAMGGAVCEAMRGACKGSLRRFAPLTVVSRSEGKKRQRASTLNHFGIG